MPTLEGLVSSEETSAAQFHTVALPAGIVDGETLIVGFEISNHLATASFPSGWTIFFSDTEGSTFASDTRLVVAWRKADGSEGSSITVETSATETSSHVAARWSGTADPTVTPPEAAAKATGTSSSPDPPQISPSGGSDTYGVMPFAGVSAEENASGAPTGYSNLTSTNAGVQDSGDETGIATATNQITGGSEDPGAFTYPNSHRWLATTVAIYPSSGTDQTVNLPVVSLSLDPGVGIGVQHTLDPVAFDLSLQTVRRSPIPLGTVSLSVEIQNLDIISILTTPPGLFSTYNATAIFEDLEPDEDDHPRRRRDLGLPND